MSRQCGFPIEDLIDYADGLLSGEDKAVVEAHLRDCPACQRRMLSEEDIGRLFRMHFAHPLDASREAPAKARPPGKRRRRLTLRWWPAVAAAVLLMFLVVAIEPATSLADFRLGRFVAFITPDNDGSPPNLPGDREPPGTHVTGLAPSAASVDSLPFQAVMPRQLPPDFVLVEHSVSDHRSLAMLYRTDRGLTLQLIEVVAGRSGATVDVDAIERIFVGGDEILLQRDSPLTDSVYRAMWERDEVLFDLWVADSPSEGLSIEHIKDIVAAVIAEQETSG